MKSNPGTVWVFFWRRTYSRLAYWSLVLGLDLRDRSAKNFFYFLYLVAFFLPWGVAVFAILGSALSQSFELFPAESPSDLVTQTAAFVLTAWGLYKLWQVSGRSPFVFSGADAYLLCQTPVSRRSLGLAWFLMDWFGIALFFAVGLISISFALTDITFSEMISLRDFPTYFAASFRSLAIFLPLQAGLQAGLYGLGALRLSRKRLPKKMVRFRITILALDLGLISALFFPHLRAIILTPFIFLLTGAFVDASSTTAWFSQFGLVMLVLFLGLANLLFSTVHMHLGRAAQETRLESVFRLARSLMNYELINNLRKQSKMKPTHSPSRLPVRSGVWMMIWKNFVQSWRSLQASQVVRWASVFFLIIGFLLSTGWIVQLTIGGLWAVSMGNSTTERVRKELARWWLLRSLPFRTSKLFLSLLGPPWVLGTLLGWLALALTSPISPFGWITVALFPFLVASAALGSTHDILEHTKSQVLMTSTWTEENVPRQDIQGALIILVSVCLPLGLLTWGNSHPGGILWALLSIPVAILISFVLLRAVISAYPWIA